MKVVAVIAVALLGCGKKGEDIDACQAAGNQYAKVWQQTAKDKSPNAFKRVSNQIGGACRGAIWEEATTKCLRAIKSRGDAKACVDKVADDDREEFVALFAELDPPPGDDCQRMAQHEVELGKAALEPLVGDERAHAFKAVVEVADAMRSACRDTSWSKDAIDCMNARSAVEDAKDCAQYFTQDQLTAFMKAITPVQ